MKLENELESFLLRIVDRLSSTWQGASDEEIETIQELSGHKLPSFYKWFLSKMGKSEGTFSNNFRDFSVSTIISFYRRDQSLVNTRWLLIGVEPDPVMPMQILLDLKSLSEGDALVVSRPVGSSSVQIGFQTFREMLAWSAMYRFRILVAKEKCSGKIELLDKLNGNTISSLNRVMDSLGFIRPISTGQYCALFESGDSSMSAMVPPSFDGTLYPYLFFQLGDSNRVRIHQILDQIKASGDLSVSIETFS